MIWVTLFFCIISGGSCVAQMFPNEDACKAAGTNLSAIIEQGYTNRTWWACTDLEGNVVATKGSD